MTDMGTSTDLPTHASQQAQTWEGNEYRDRSKNGEKKQILINCIR